MMIHDGLEALGSLNIPYFPCFRSSALRKGQKVEMWDGEKLGPPSHHLSFSDRAEAAKEMMRRWEGEKSVKVQGKRTRQLSI